jgi:F-type H+-transporting ATPase subunit delta
MAETSPTAKPKSRAVNVGAQQVAAIYAKAFLGAAENLGQTDVLVAELGAVSDSLGDFPQLEAVFASALVSPDEKSQLLERLYGARLSGTLLDFLKVVARHGRLDVMSTINELVGKLYDELRGRVRVQLRTATPVDDSLSRNLTASLTKLLGGEPKLESEVDAELIGGLMLRVGDTVYDGSVARQLAQVREQMINRSVHEIQSRRDSFRHSGGN